MARAVAGAGAEAAGRRRETGECEKNKRREEITKAATEL